MPDTMQYPLIVAIDYAHGALIKNEKALLNYLPKRLPKSIYRPDNAEPVGKREVLPSSALECVRVYLLPCVCCPTFRFAFRFASSSAL